MNILFGNGLIKVTHHTGKGKRVELCVCVPTTTNYCNLSAFFSHFKDIQFSNVMYVRLYLLLLLFRKKNEETKNRKKMSRLQMRIPNLGFHIHSQNRLH